MWWITRLRRSVNQSMMLTILISMNCWVIHHILSAGGNQSILITFSQYQHTKTSTWHALELSLLLAFICQSGELLGTRMKILCRDGMVLMTPRNCFANPAVQIPMQIRKIQTTTYLVMYLDAWILWPLAERQTVGGLEEHLLQNWTRVSFQERNWNQPKGNTHN